MNIRYQIRIMGCLAFITLLSTWNHGFAAPPAVVERLENIANDEVARAEPDPIRINSVKAFGLAAATYFGGANQEQGWPSTPAVVAADGNIIFALLAYSPGLATSGSYRPAYIGNGDVLIVKMNPQLTSVIAATYLGGSGSDSPSCIGIDSVGNIFVGGSTSSPDFPIIPGAYDGIRMGDEGFVAKFSADLGTLMASTFIGGNASDGVDDIALSPDGSVFIVIETASHDLITSPGAIRTSYYGGANDYFMACLDGTLSTASAATYLGGNREDWGASLHLDADGNIYLTGSTFSTDVPITPGAFDAVNGGNSLDGIIMHINKQLTTILASTYIGGNYPDWIYCLDLAKNGDIYISGHADSQWPVTPGCFDATYGGGPPDQGSDSYVARMSSDLSTLKASTYLGGYSWDWGVDIVVDSNDHVYVAGESISPDFPLTPDAFDTIRGDTTEMFVSEFDSTLSTIHMSTFVGGTGLDRWPGLLINGNKNIYIVGYTEAGDLPVAVGTYDPSYNGGGDIYIAKLYDSPCCMSPGDANNDTKVNVGDAVFMINLVFKAGPAPMCKDQGDANHDCRLNVGDAVFLINYVFKAGTAPKCGCIDS